MKEYALILSHRPKIDEDVKEKHKGFSNSLMKYHFPWGYGDSQVPDVNIDSAELVYVVKLKELSPRGLRSYITYSLRSDQYLRDVAEHDDKVVIELKPQDLNLSLFIKEILPHYIECFDCYRASIINRDLSTGDWSVIVDEYNSTGKDIDGRDSVYRINEINFYDRELCKRAFNLTPEKIVGKLEGKVEYGVILIYSSTLLPQEELEQIDTKVKGWLGCK